MKLTALGSGYYRVYKDGVEYSKHTSEREALETAFALEASNPSLVVTYKHDYEVKVESELVSPTPIPTPTPVASTLYGSNNLWSKKLDPNAPIDPNSSNLVASLQSDIVQANGAWINTTKYSTPLYIVDTDIPKVIVNVVEYDYKQVGNEWYPSGIKATNNRAGTALYAELQQGFRVPANAVQANGGDGHITIWDKIEDKLFEAWQFSRLGGVSIAWGAVIKNVSQSAGFIARLASGERQGAAATGLPVIFGTMLLSELQSGVIPHALRFIVINAKNTFVAPAVDTDGNSTSPNAIPEGKRFRLPANFVIPTTACSIMRMAMTAVRDYGMILTDKGGTVCFFAEDTAQYGGDKIAQFYGGLQIWDVIKQFPFNKLQALA